MGDGINKNDLSSEYNFVPKSESKRQRCQTAWKEAKKKVFCLYCEVDVWMSKT